MPLILERTALCVISFDITISVPKLSIPFCSKISDKSCFVLSIIISITALSFPVFITSFETREENTKSIAFRRILFPAPVSPVIILSPESKLAHNSSINI